MAYDPYVWPNTVPIHGRRFVRAKSDPNEPEYDPSSNDTFFLGISTAEIAANWNLIDCACCGSKEICREPVSRPWTFGTLTSDRTGHLYGYALCEPCCELRKSDPDAFMDRVDTAFDEAIGEVA